MHNLIAIFLSIAIAAEPATIVFTQAQIKSADQIMTDTANVFFYLRALTSKEEYAQFEAEFKKMGITEHTPMPKVPAGLNMSTLGDISNGKNTWRFNRSQNLFQNYLTLKKFLDTGHVSASRYSLLPQAHATNENAKDVLSQAMFAVRGVVFFGLGLAVAATFSGVAGVTLGSGALVLAILLSLDHALIGASRKVQGIEMECRGNELLVAYTSAGTRKLAPLSSELGKKNVSTAEREYRTLVCEHGSVLAALNTVVAKIKSAGQAAAMPAEKATTAH